MAERSEILSNLAGLAVAGLVMWQLMTPAAQSAGPGGGAPLGEPMTIDTTPPEPELPPPPPQPTPPPMESPPPPPPPVEEPKPEEPPKPDEKAEIKPVAEEGERPPPPPPPVSEEAAAKFRSCLQKHMAYPSTKEALKKRPKGKVVVRAVVSPEGVTSHEIMTSSGSPILDSAAVTTLLKSGCGLLGESGSVTGTFDYGSE
jgi:TonB family protein